MAQFSGARLKVKRANQHIDEFNAVLQTFVDRGICAVRIEADPESGHETAHYGIILDLPEMLPCILGDAIHNIRSALDLMLWEAVKWSGGVPNKETVFPWGNNRDDVIGRLNKGEAKVLGPAIIEGIFADCIKPYKGGNDALLSLKALDIKDKHHLIIPVAHYAYIEQVRAEITDANGVVPWMTVTGNNQGSMTLPGKIQLTYNPQPALFVAFDKGCPFENEPIFPTLKQLNKLVLGYIEAVEEIFV